MSDSLREMVEREMRLQCYTHSVDVYDRRVFDAAVDVALRLLSEERERIDGLAKTYDSVSSGYLERVRKHHRDGALVCKVCAQPGGEEGK